MKKANNLFFRIKENGASVFRVDSNNRHHRLELMHIASVNVKNSEIRPQGDYIPTETENENILAWVAKRQELNIARKENEILQTIDSLSLTAQWFQSKATEAQVERFSDDLLMAMHDLRSVIVRKKSEKLQKNK